MKNTAINIALIAALFGTAAAQASEFDGAWVGGKVGKNRASATGLDSQKPTSYGLEGGYNWNMSNYLLGINGFADINKRATHAPGAINYGSHVYGLDAKLGVPYGKWLPYAKLGVAQTSGNGDVVLRNIDETDVHLGLGVEYKFAPSWSLTGEVTRSTAESAGTELRNRNFTIGINYYFGGARTAPVSSNAAELERAEYAEEVVAEAEVEQPSYDLELATPRKTEPATLTKETWKTLLEEKALVIEGAHFDFDSAKLRPTANAKLNEVVEFAAAYPDAKLEISGYTDSVGAEKYNLTLSERRAAAVKKYLVDKGVPDDRIDRKGYGEADPVASNKTKEGRAKNRRVEIRSVGVEETLIRVIN